MQEKLCRRRAHVACCVKDARVRACVAGWLMDKKLAPRLDQSAADVCQEASAITINGSLSHISYGSKSCQICKFAAAHAARQSLLGPT